MLLSAITAGLVTLASALPMQQGTLPQFLYQNSSSANYPGYLVHAIQSKHKKSWILSLANPQSAGGTPFTTSVSTSNPSKLNINFEINGQSYGMKLPEVGDDDGIERDVRVHENYTAGQWTFGENGDLGYQKQDALSLLLLCKDTKLDGPYLSYGNPNINGSLPEGCVYAEILRTIDTSNE